MQELLNSYSINITDITVLHNDAAAVDEIIWERSASGALTVKEAYNFYRDKATVVQWEKKIWRPYIQPKISVFIWKC